MAALCRPDTVTHGAMEVALLFRESQMFIRCDAGRVDRLESVQPVRGFTMTIQVRLGSDSSLSSARKRLRGPSV